jgi:malonate-semialdehyde dehydrogenase (acetylating)/methylmalonate-semialdehyde dehydrogenase
MTDSMRTVLNYIDGEWRQSLADAYLEVFNPATVEVMGKVPLSPADEVDQAAQAAARAFVDWRRTPPLDRIQYLFKLKTLLEEQFEDLSRTITMECGKTLDESGRDAPGDRNVEVAAHPDPDAGYNSEDIARDRRADDLPAAGGGGSDRLSTSRA